MSSRLQPRSFGFSRSRLSGPLIAVFVCLAAGGATLSLPHAARCADSMEGARRAALDHIDSEFRRAEKEPRYWKEAWQCDTVLVRDRIRLGQPYRVGSVLAQDVELFAITGALRPTYGYSVYFPVYHEERRIKIVIVKEKNGVWRWDGRADGRNSENSLAVHYATDETDVSIVSIKGLGRLMILEPAQGGPKSVIPLAFTMELLAPMIDSTGTVPYDEAVRALQPMAREVAERYKRRMEEER